MNFKPKFSSGKFLNNQQIQKSLLIYTGGTIGMKKDNNGLLTATKGFLSELVTNSPVFQSENIPLFDIFEFDNPMDSCDMDTEQWGQIAKIIEQNYQKYQGFVVLTGTDTMSYISTALSFMLENLKKPVIFTGSQVPCSESHSDSMRNLILAMIFTQYKDLKEVCLFFNDKLLRANRSSKISSNSFSAFNSSNYPPLAEVGVEIHFSQHLLWENQNNDTFKVHYFMDSRVICIKLVPGFDDEAICAIIKKTKNTKAIILETYGAGNIPSKKKQMLQLLQIAKDKGILICCTSQCKFGGVSGVKYAVAKIMQDMGVVFCGDMTTEATATKIAYLLGKGYKYDKIQYLMKKSIRGEITEISDQR